MTIKYTHHPTPIGELTLAESERGLALVLFPGETSPAGFFPDDHCIADPDSCANARHQLDAYFSGQRTTFDLKLDLRTTSFFKNVLNAVATVPYGKTTTYSEIARKIGRPKAVRAVGAANARNPIPIVIPCHRIVGKNGLLTGYGGGLDRKRYLLNLESSQTSLL